MTAMRTGNGAVRLLPAALAAVFVLGVVPDVAVQASELDTLSWLAGHWRSTRDGNTTEEVWLAPAGGLMVGVNRELIGGRDRAFFEYLRIELVEGRIRFVASPRGREGTVFSATEASDKRVVFENPEHDWPQRLLYERGDDGTLRVEASGLEEGSRRLTWTHHRVESP